MSAGSKFELLCLHVHRSPVQPSPDSSVAARYWPGRMQSPFVSTKSTMRGWGSSFRSSKSVYFQQLPPPSCLSTGYYSCRRRDTCAATIFLTFTIQGLMNDNTQYTSVWTSGHWSLKSLSQHANRSNRPCAAICTRKRWSTMRKEPVDTMGTMKTGMV
jgi:hypothetical protein